MHSSMLAGVGQTLQTLTGSRALNTTYTNSTGRPIYVIVYATSTNTAMALGAMLNSIQVAQVGVAILGAAITQSLIVPNGVTYSIAATNMTLNAWHEIR